MFCVLIQGDDSNLGIASFWTLLRCKGKDYTEHKFFDSWNLKYQSLIHLAVFYTHDR